MPVSELELYGSWCLGLLDIPARSRLYHLESIATDTPYVEGLVSYICRLAEAHCVSPGILTQQEILPRFREIYTVAGPISHTVRSDGTSVSVSSFPTPEYRKNPNEYGLLAWQYIEGLESLTLKNNLQALTIPFWHRTTSQLHREMNLAREIRAWCPDCFQLWLESEQPIYEPLIWSIAAITICPHHRQPLRSRCPHCHKTQRPITGKMQVGRCSSCFGWLNIPSEKSSDTELSIAAVDWHLWVAERVMEVLRAKPRIPGLETRSVIDRVIHGKEQPQFTYSDNSAIKQEQRDLLEVFAQWTD